LNEHSIRVLEFDRIRESLLDQCSTDGGKSLVLTMQSFERLEEIEHALVETTQAKNFLTGFGNLPFLGIHSIGELVRMCVLGSSIDPKDLLDLLTTLQLSREIKTLLETQKENIPAIWQVAQKIRPQLQLEQIISRTIDENGEILDSASDRLASIRVQMKLVHTRIQSKLNEIMKTSSYSKMIQDPIVTLRDDRFVIPLKGEYKNHFPCIIHDSSTSGQTLFVEPLSVIPLNNDLRNLREREREEIQVILALVAKEISFKSADLEILDDTISTLDFIFGKAKLSINWKCTQPEVDSKPRIKIVSGKHPLLGVEPVPIDITIGDEYRMIILTGPNTGGKTVTLKTVGLFVVMTRHGLHVPASNGTVIGIFDDILVDIGDEQSIQQNLSTFSSHMTNIVSIIRELSRFKLILLDELGAGTDPSEGSALAYAITDYLYHVGTQTIITTHIGDLKNFAYNNSQAVNASVGFDAKTLQPTYKIHIGLPGASHAFDVARKLGLPEEILLLADNYVRTEDKDSAKIISRMAEDAKVIMEEREQITRAKESADDLLRQREEELRNLEENKSKMLDRELSKARRFFNEKLQEAEEIVKKLAKATRQNKETDQLHTRLQEIHTEIVEATKETTEPQTTTSDSNMLKIGEFVYVPKFKSQGVVMDVYPDKGKILVQVGSARVQLPISAIEILTEPVEDEIPVATEERPKFNSVGIKIELFGMPIEDALHKLERYLDSAFGAGLPFIYIVHGRGSGALKKAIQDYLPLNLRVDRFHLADIKDGGDAVTIVFLK